MNIFKKIVMKCMKIRYLELSRRNLKKNFYSYHLHNFKTYIARQIYIRLRRRRYSFVSTNIEIFGVCNRECPFCFNNPKFPQRDKGRMEQKVWQKIIDELSSLKFSGRISPHLYGEPLLDDRLPSFISYARKKCPNSYILFSTNGDYLTEKILLDLIERGVDFLTVTNYDDNENKKLNYLEKKYPGHLKVRSYMDFKKTDRSGEIYKRGLQLQIPCLRPTGQLVINWEGDILLCCMDYYAKVKFGNVKQQKIIDIWNSADFIKYRNQLKLGKRNVYAICKHCDDSGELPR